MPPTPAKIAPPSDDKRWRIVTATMRKHGFEQSALIETLHVAQEAFGFLDETALIYIAKSLHVPLSLTIGVATFYNHFKMKPAGDHTCVVCTGTACYIKGAAALLEAIQAISGASAGETTEDKTLSVMVARCIGACGMAPAAVFDGDVVGNLEPDHMAFRIKEWMKHADE